jgi:tetratricopeptide (TPR) repeat protein
VAVCESAERSICGMNALPGRGPPVVGLRRERAEPVPTGMSRRLPDVMGTEPASWQPGERMRQNRGVFGRLRQWRRGSSQEVSANNVMSGVARDVVQAGYIGHVSFNGSGDGALELTIPSLGTIESLLSFANTTVEYVGRAGESEELKGFLAAGTPFSWWVWTGPAGIGKSRLAVELCRFAAAEDWHAGFLREVDQAGLATFEPRRPSLIVIDYAAQRSTWLSDALIRLSGGRHEFPVRILVLERSASGEWWSVTQRVNRMEESHQVAAAMYAKPREMFGLNRADARTLVVNTAARLDSVPLTAGQVELIVDRAVDMDPVLRPLFVQVAAIDRLDKGEERFGRDDALRRVIARQTAWLTTRLASPQSAALVDNVRLLATSLGGLTVEDYESLLPPPGPITDLLPGVFQVLAPAVTIGDLVDGVRPDIVGELFVLDRFDAETTVVLASGRLLGYAARKRPDAYRGFVERLVADHTDHPRLLDLLKVSGDGESPVSDLELAVPLMQLLGRSDHPVVEWIFERINAEIKTGVVEATSRLVATARFKFATLVWREHDAQRACDLYTEALADCDPTWPEYGSILNNRGLALGQLGRTEESAADFSTVIESSTVSAEIRACALNNRADIRDESGDLDEAIADRSALLTLPGTSYDRRYIALARRAQALREQGRHSEAYDDIAGILDTDDIVVEQKMEARLIRAEWAREDGDPEGAHSELCEIAASYRNFENVEKKVRELIAMPTADLPAPQGGL